jgi:hypothetical protein
MGRVAERPRAPFFAPGRARVGDGGHRCYPLFRGRIFIFAVILALKAGFAMCFQRFARLLLLIENSGGTAW